MYRRYGPPRRAYRRRSWTGYRNLRGKYRQRYYRNRQLRRGRNRSRKTAWFRRNRYYITGVRF